MNNKEKELIDFYKDMKFSQNSVCQRCRSNTRALSHPVSAWLVGNNFYNHEKRVLFVGKNARNEPGRLCGDFICAYEMGRNLWNDMQWPYWSYTRAIAGAVYGSDSIENIAFTNIVKCNNSGGKDTTSEYTKNCCINELKVIYNEIKIIEPTHIVFYTADKYDENIFSIFDAFKIKSDLRISVGKKEMPWLEAEVLLDEKKLHILRIGHPERMKMSDYVTCVSEWIQRN